jgi:dTDP-glucose pyrophosphorylase
VLLAKDYINNEESLLISDSDHFIDGNAVMTGIQTYADIDGIIPVFHSNDPKWSFSRVNKDGYVDLVAEKQPVSEWANIGAYYFRRGKDFIQGIEEMIKNNELTNNEFYVAPVYNKLIEKGMKIKLVVPKYVYGLGTPDDLEYFIKNTHFVL